MKTRAAVVRTGQAGMAIEELDLAGPRPDEMLVRLVATGICHTDIVAASAGSPVPRPVVLGHEGAGTVEAVGQAVSGFAAGDHVVLSYASCGNCPSCVDHAPAYCFDMLPLNFGGSRADGTSPLSKGGEMIHGSFFGQSSFAGFAICKARNAVKVRPDAPLKLLGPLGCGVQTGAGAVLNVLRPGPGRSIAVFGTGAVGLSAVMAARLAGAGTIIAVDRVPQRLQLALELGATHALDASGGDTVDEIMRLTGHGVDRTLNTTVSEAVLAQAVRCLAPRGICGTVAARAGQVLELEVRHVMLGGRQIRGVIQGDSTPGVLIPALIDLYMQGRFSFDRMVRFYPFERINEAIHDAESGATVKPILLH